jgi:hypothetical protein
MWFTRRPMWILISQLMNHVISYGKTLLCLINYAIKRVRGVYKEINLLTSETNVAFHPGLYSMK